MDGIHDLGGKRGYGPVIRERDEPVFHDRWEAVVFTLTRTARSAGALQNTDQFRYAIERIDPVAYLTHGYYGRWLGGLENLFVEAGTLTPGEIEARLVALGGDPDAPVAARPDPGARPFDPPSHNGAQRSIETAPLFKPGDRVMTANLPSAGHTRLPAYARGRSGIVQTWHQGWVYPDSNAVGRGEGPEHLYTVAFSGSELWGGDAEPGMVLHLDLFEPYLAAC
ncbi:MAG: nitrile hydratase subunit beta [Pseudomonadales bacterium]|nr:nitrile hydratase subunit beta [Pseudomonadales bacterium]